LLLAAVLILVGCQSGADDPFLVARRHFVKGDYAVAEKMLSQYVNQPGGQYASRAGLFLCKAGMARDDLPFAAKWCQWTIDNHPDSLEAHKCRYKLAVISLLQGDDELAASRFKAIADRPDGPLAAEARAMERYVRARLPVGNAADARE
jgi:TolA-binding protein